MSLSLHIPCSKVVKAVTFAGCGGDAEVRKPRLGRRPRGKGGYVRSDQEEPTKEWCGIRRNPNKPVLNSGEQLRRFPLQVRGI